MVRSLLGNLPAIIQYIGKIPLPFNLSVLPIIQDTTFVYGFIAITLLTIALFLSKNKCYNFIIFGSFWFILFLLPSFIQPNPAIVAYFIEHRIYLPIIGFIIILLETDMIKNLIAKKNSSPILGAVIVLVLLTIITFNHSKNFKNRLNFWENAVKTSPHSSLAHRNLGTMYYLEEQPDKAESKYKKSLELNPQEPMVHNNLGLVYMKKNMFKKAEEEFRKELAINPSNNNVRFNLRLLYYKQNKLKDAQGTGEGL
jgi:tetratricopeptide (TPR) repeat protein